VGHLAGPSEDWYNALVFAVWYLYRIKITYSTLSNLGLRVLQFAISIIVESIYFVWYCGFSPTKAANWSVLSSSIHSMHWLPNMHDQKLFPLCYWLFLSWGNVDVMHCVAWEGRQYFVYELLPQSTLRLPKMHAQKSLMLYWSWFPDWSTVGVAFVVAPKGR